MAMVLTRPRGYVAVTGAGGFVGRALCEHFREAERPFIGLVRSPDPGGVLSTSIHPIGDLAQAGDAALGDALAGASAVVHLAARVHLMRERSADPERAYREANVVATERVARAALRAGVSRFVYASTVKVSGETSPPRHPIAPGDAPHPRDAYARSKYEGEKTVARIAAGTPMAAIVLRFPLVYGPGVRGHFATLMSAIGRRRTLPLAALRARRSVLYVGNLVSAIDAALDAAMPPAGVHFVTDRESVTIAELARAIGGALGVPARLVRVAPSLVRAGAKLAGRGPEAMRLTSPLEVDASSFTAATGWRAPYSLAEGLARTASWWRAQNA